MGCRHCARESDWAESTEAVTVAKLMIEIRPIIISDFYLKTKPNF